MTTPLVTPLEPGHRIQLPSEWADALGLHGAVALERTVEGILIRPWPTPTWDDFFASKLKIGSGPVRPDDEANLEVTGDDLLF